MKKSKLDLIEILAISAVTAGIVLHLNSKVGQTDHQDTLSGQKSEQQIADTVARDTTKIMDNFVKNIQKTR